MDLCLAYVSRWIDVYEWPTTNLLERRQNKTAAEKMRLRLLTVNRFPDEDVLEAVWGNN